MTTRLDPYLNFPGSAREAMLFYETVFGGTLTITTVGDAGGVPWMVDIAGPSRT